MRTTLEIDDDVMEAVKEIARLRSLSIGRALSEYARRGISVDLMPVVEDHGGIPVWVHKPGAIPVTNELVRNLADEE